MSINVSLPIELENRVREHVESGLYGSASEVIREALRLFETYHSVQSNNLVALKAAISKGMDDIENNRVSSVDIADIKLQGRTKFIQKGRS